MKCTRDAEGRDMDINFNFQDSFGRSFELITSQEVYSFLELEKKYWLEQVNKEGNNLGGSFIELPQQVDRFIPHLELYERTFKNISQPDNHYQVERNYENEKSIFINWCSSYWIYRGNEFTEALIDSYRYSPTSGKAFWYSLKNKSIEGTGQSFDAFIGNVMAYEFKLQDQAQLVKRKNAEKRTFATLRNELEAERTTQLKNFELFQDEYSDWYQKLQEKFESWILETEDRTDSTITNHSYLFNQMTDHAIERHKELEQLYVEKLRLEKPAIYWEERAKRLKSQGIVWAVLLALVLVLGLGYFTFLFTHWLVGQEIALSLHSLQGAVLLAVIISTFIFSIRVLSRLVFSSFHLQRDAEERQQLAYVYLALSNETNVDEESRKIVLQALFSRAETGLLASESGPTMPGIDGVTGLMSKVSKG